MYIAGWNLPGYLPETEPEVFDTLKDALHYLQEVSDRWYDEDFDLENPTEPAEFSGSSEGIDGWYGDIHLWAEVYNGM